MAIFLRLVGLVFLLIAGCVIAVQNSSTSWPATEGVIVKAGWERESTDVGVKGFYDIRYDYTVDGKKYRNDRLSYSNGNYVVTIVKAAMDGLENVERTPQPEDIVNVYYAPWWPQVSTLVTGMAPTSWIWGLVALLGAAICWGFASLSKEPIL
jgi:Protein of unknown function (DUF3592)